LPDVISTLPLPAAADHVHPAGAVTAKLPVPPDADADAEVGESERVQDAPAWVIWNVWPPTEIAPLREELLLLVAME
jgi:hypothetical protein